MKFNESLASNKAMREQIESLRQERAVFDSVYKRTEASLVEKKRQMALTIEASNQVRCPSPPFLTSPQLWVFLLYLIPPSFDRHVSILLWTCWSWFRIYRRTRHEMPHNWKSQRCIKALLVNARSMRKPSWS